MICLGPGCTNQLTGKQKRWCSDACRKKAARTIKKNVQGKIIKRPGLSGYFGDDVGRKVQFTLKIKVNAIQTTPGLGNYQVDAHLRRVENCDIYAKMIENVMNEIVFGYQVSVSVVLF
jgi:hypothetical protein